MDISNPIEVFDLEKIKSSLENLKYSEKDFLKRACYLYYLGSYIEAYNNLRISSKLAFKNKNFSIWFISEFNRKYLAKKLYSLYKLENIVLNMEILNDVEFYIDLDLQDIYVKLPGCYKEVVKPFLNLELNLKDKVIQAFKLANDSGNSKGRYDYNSNIIFYLIEDIKNTLHFLYLTIEHTDFIKNVFENLFRAAVYEYIYEKERNFYYNFVYAGIVGFKKWINLQNFLEVTLETKKLDIVDKNFEEQYEILLRAFQNLTKVRRNIHKYRKEYITYFYNFIIILSYFNLSKEKVKEILKLFQGLLKETPFLFEDYNVIALFITKHMEKIEDRELIFLLEAYIKKIVCNKISVYDLESSFYSPFIFILFEEMRKRSIFLENEELIYSCLYTLKKFKFDFVPFVYYFLSAVYQLVNSKNLRNSMKNDFKNFKKEFKQFLGGKHLSQVDIIRYKTHYIKFSLILESIKVDKIDADFIYMLEKFLKENEKNKELIQDLKEFIRFTLSKIENKEIKEKLKTILLLNSNSITDYLFFIG